MKNEVEIIQGLKKEVVKLNERNKVLYEYTTTETDKTNQIVIIPAKYLSENYRIEITGVSDMEGLMAMRVHTNQKCCSGVISTEGGQVQGLNYTAHWGCFFAKAKISYFNAIINVCYNEMYNGYSFTSQFSSVSVTNKINISGTASGSEYNTGKNYDLVLGLQLRAGSKIKIIKQP